VDAVTATHVGTYDVHTPEWHAARANGLGGSDVAAALGLSPWCSPFTLWHRLRGEVGPQEASQSMDWGNRLEPAVYAAFLERNDFVGWRYHPGTFRDDWRIANPDALLGGAHGVALLGLWEGKTADAHDAWKWGPDGSDEPDAIPVYYRIQTLWYGDVLGVHDIWLSVLIGGNDFRTYRVPWDPDEAALIRDRAAEFWRTVVDGERPDIDATSSTYETVRELHPDIDADDVEVPGPLADDYLASDLAAKATDSAAREAKSRLLDAMGSARIARHAITGAKVARRQPNGKGVSLYPIHPKD
jgi:putative phage-type endonuclease